MDELFLPIHKLFLPFPYKQAVIPKIISVAATATICAPKISSYFGSHKILTKPSFSTSSIALSFADNGKK